MTGANVVVLLVGIVLLVATVLTVSKLYGKRVAETEPGQRWQSRMHPSRTQTFSVYKEHEHGEAIGFTMFIRETGQKCA